MTAVDHDVDHLARLILAETRVRVGTVTGRLNGFRSGQTLTMIDDRGQSVDVPWDSDLLQVAAIDDGKLRTAQDAQGRLNAEAMQAKRIVAAAGTQGMTPEQVTAAVHQAIVDRRNARQGTVRP